MSTTTYNGWTNYETWAVALWLDNEEGSYRTCRARAEDEYRDAAATKHWSRYDIAISRLADRLQSDHEEACPVTEGVFADLLNAALSEVNWLEIAGHYVDEIKDEIDREEQAEQEEAQTD